MTDIVLTPITSGYNLSKINYNFEKIQNKFNDETLLNTGGNNIIYQDLDMNSNQIINVGPPLEDHNAVRLIDIKNALTDAAIGESAALSLFKLQLQTTPGANLVGFKQEGVGTIQSTVQDALALVLNVKDYGAKGDGIADDTNAIQAAINDIESRFTSDYWSVYCAKVHIPFGVYNIRGIVINYPIELYGDGVNSTILNLIDGANQNVITINDTGIHGGADSANTMASIHDLSIGGNSSGQSGDGFSRGISLTDSTIPIGTAYRGGANISNVNIRACQQFSIYIGTNRNNGRIHNVKSLYSGSDAVYSNGYDWRVDDSDFGNSQTGHGWNQNSGGALELSNSNLFFNGGAGYHIGIGVNACCIATNCYFDTNAFQGAYLENFYGNIVAHSINNSVFRDNSRNQDAFSPHIQLDNQPFTILNGNTFVVNDTTKQPSYLVLSGGTAGVILFNSQYESIDTLHRPFRADITNDFTKLLFSGNQNSGLAQLSINSVGIVGTTPNFDLMDLSSPINTKRYRYSVSSGTLKLSTADDGGTTNNTILQVTRSGTIPSAISTIPLAPLADNTFNLGTGSFRWATVFAGSGTINTSDEREKKEIESIPDEVLDAWSEVNYCQFKYKDGNRLHIGMIAQRVKEAFEKHSIDPFKYGILCYDTWEDKKEVTDNEGNILFPEVKAGDIYGIRYEEALCLEAALMRRTLNKLGLV